MNQMSPFNKGNGANKYVNRESRNTKKRAADGQGLNSVFHHDDIYTPGGQGAYHTTAGGLVNRMNVGSRNKGAGLKNSDEMKGSYHKFNKE